MYVAAVLFYIVQKSYLNKKLHIFGISITVHNFSSVAYATFITQVLVIVGK